MLSSSVKKGETPWSTAQIDAVVKILKREAKGWPDTAVARVSRHKDPFKVLISCILSLRTKDQVTGEASGRLFAIARTPEDILKLTRKKIETAIYPVGFYRKKAETIHDICRALLLEFGGETPDEIDDLLKLNGVGRKTANLVVTLGYGKPGICVDTHVHRISNRLGYIKTKRPDESEFKLREKLPKRHWIAFNELLVSFGRNICRPISPLCSTCPVKRYCRRVGVGHHR